ncbi:MAG: hypothetical protein K2J92_07665, partial [Muribaculaceae bacterium]|nr:hypothetical protein [Muribaculaceae bacterium]
MAYSENNNTLTRYWLRLVMWRERNFSENNFVMFLALVVGILCGFAAQLLKFLIHLISHFLTSHIQTTTANYVYLIYPMVGILLVTLFVRYVAHDTVSHGVT